VPLALESADPLRDQLTEAKFLGTGETIVSTNLSSGFILGPLHIQRSTECPFSRTTGSAPHCMLLRVIDEIPVVVQGQGLVLSPPLSPVIRKSYKRIPLLQESDSD